ncbi:40S small subunit processome assembly factor 1 isoform X3 [Podarcis muralis]|uniref:uncharacterized protein C1orf131 homolog isoform X3 n=1 Tax=Podarcis muralis TaxID=64176 RepID=UPI0010A0B664|nr:uncharacterized protein C1orf131 homolog isoform X3 [Podarcis muralis]
MAATPAAGCELKPGEDDREEKGSASASCLLDAVLSSLYDFGESLPDGGGKKKSKKRNSNEKLTLAVSKTQVENKSMIPESGAVPLGKKNTASSFFESLKDELAYDCIHQKSTIPKSSSPDADTFKSARLGNTTEIEVVTFHGRRRKKKAKLEIAEDGGSKAELTVQENHAADQEFNLEKPPKKQYLNYKILQQKIKETKAAKKEENMTENKPNSLKRQKKKGPEESRKSKKKKKQSMLPTGQVGTFKNGTLILRSSDIKKIKSSKVIK